MYRNVLIKGHRRLFGGHEFSVIDSFLELEQANRQMVLISWHGIIRICEPGTEVLCETVTLK